MQVSETNKPAQDIAVAFGNVLAQSLSGACDSTWTVAPSGESAKQTPAAETAIFFRISFSGPIETEMFFGVQPTEVHMFGFRGVPQASNESQVENLSALQAVLDAAARALPRVFSGGSAITMRVERVATPQLPDEHALELIAQVENAKTRVSMLLFFDEALVTAMENMMAQTVSRGIFQDCKPQSGARCRTERNAPLRAASTLAAGGA